MMAFHLGEPDRALLTHALDNMQKILAAQPDDHTMRFWFGGLLSDAGYRKRA